MIVENVQNTVVPQMDFEKYKMISYTQLSLWLECPHKWKLMYIDKLKQPPNIHLAFGSAMHESLQEYFELMYNKSMMKADEFDIHEDFQQRFMKMYKDYKDQIGENFSTKKEIMEFVNDGLNIIDFFLQRRQMYFSKKGTRLLGIEMPILTPPHKDHPNIMLYGKLDLVFYDEDLKKVTIWDIKTSTRGWGKWDKENKIKMAQMVLYKKYFADQYKVPVDSIDCKYFIVKRKIPKNPKYPAMSSRIQTYEPSSGKVTMNRVSKYLHEFIEDCFKDDMYQTKEYTKNPSDKNCRWCPFKDKPELCDKNHSK
tara:strand:- start:539 stop:1468 length:930 start_codon:yes stop_codon:yes gene_type:complete